MGLANWWANWQDPRYAPSNQKTAPNDVNAMVDDPSPARTGQIEGSIFRSLTNYTEFTGGLCFLWQDGREVLPLTPFGLPYQQAGTRPAKAGPQGMRPKLSAFTNKALGAANAGRNQAIPFQRGPVAPVQPERSFAVPISHFWDQFPKGTSPWYNRQPGIVTRWPAAQMTYNQTGGG